MREMIPDEVNQRFIRQDVPGLRKRWFQGESTDLAIWQDPQGRVVHFQLLVEPDRIIDFEAAKGMITGRVDQSRRSGQHAASPVVVADAVLSRETLKLAFDAFTAEPPLQTKRVLKFVAEALDAALSRPEHPMFPSGELPPGEDSVFTDARKLQAERAERERRRGIIDRLLEHLPGLSR
ncbi:MAG: hypothetical protein HY816_16125 [Candidatus Wallbacteria bacterium]|nr:hypothetical protein [Candidatus Wallbacteria bacterium]